MFYVVFSIIEAFTCSYRIHFLWEHTGSISVLISTGKSLCRVERVTFPNERWKASDYQKKCPNSAGMIMVLQVEVSLRRIQAKQFWKSFSLFLFVCFFVCLFFCFLHTHGQKPPSGPTTCWNGWGTEMELSKLRMKFRSGEEVWEVNGCERWMGEWWECSKHLLSP